MLTSPVARPMVASDDYDAWEQTISAEDLRGLCDPSELTTIVCDVTFRSYSLSRAFTS
jgi:hypothetical protein